MKIVVGLTISSALSVAAYIWFNYGLIITLPVLLYYLWMGMQAYEQEQAEHDEQVDNAHARLELELNDAHLRLIADSQYMSGDYINEVLTLLIEAAKYLGNPSEDARLYYEDLAWKKTGLELVLQANALLNTTDSARN